MLSKMVAAIQCLGNSVGGMMATAPHYITTIQTTSVLKSVNLKPSYLPSHE